MAFSRMQMRGKDEMNETLSTDMRQSLDTMILRTKTKLIAPVLTAGVLRCYLSTGTADFSESEMRAAYEREVCSTVREVLGHSMHVGGSYEDAYSSRTLPKYGIVSPVGLRRYRLTSGSASQARAVMAYVLAQVPTLVAQRLGGVVRLQSPTCRLELASCQQSFVALLDEEMSRSAPHFEIISFAILKVHLEKFACKVYRSSCTSARDHGVDIATDFGAVYQVKKLHLRSQQDLDEVCNELMTNFDAGRLSDGKVVLVIDDASPLCRQYLLDMRVQPLVRGDVLGLAAHISDPEDREKVLRVVHDEFQREYQSDVCMACRTRPRVAGCQFIPEVAVRPQLEAAP